VRYNGGETDRQTDRDGVMRLAHLDVVRAGVVEVADLWHADEQIIREEHEVVDDGKADEKE